MRTLRDTLDAELKQLRADSLYRELRRIDSAQGPRVNVSGRDLLNFSSNDYLGLANDPALKRAAAKAIERWGVGAGASRLVCGNLAPYEELETKLATFKRKEAAIVFGSGYAANVGTITALVGKGDVIILDKLDHASIIDGARQSGATIRVYPHKNMKKLEALLQGATGRVLIVTETVFSMDGDLAPLAEIVALKEKYGAWLMVDEAHATGVFGAGRRGLAEALGVEDQIDVTLGTLSKALGCVGGYVVGSQTLIDFLRNRARSLIYSTALPPAMCAAAAAAVDFVMSDEGARRRDRLWANVRALGAQSPIHPVIVGDETAAVELSQKLLDRCIFVPAIRYPTVPKNKARLRVTVSAAHTREDVEQLLSVVGAAFLPRSSNLDSSGRGRNAAPTQPAPHSGDLRKGGISISGECCFITTCTKGKRPLLADPNAAKVVIDALCWLRDQGRIRLLGFVVMPDHVHAAFALRSRQECRSHSAPSQAPMLSGSDIPVATLPEIMRAWKGYARHEIRRKVDPDFCWQDGYYDTLLRDRHDFEEHLDYMHDNPRRKGLVGSAEKYPFSTAHPDYEKEIDWAWLEGNEEPK